MTEADPLRDARPPDPRPAALARMKWIAAALLAAALGGLALAHAMGGAGVWGWVRAGCEAAAVGAIADWFAVVALFRYPLGVRLPHTAIIPQGKARIADSLADFVRDHFLDPDLLLARLALFDPAARVGAWMRDPQRVTQWVAAARTWALAALDVFDDARMRRALLSMVMTQARRWDAASTAGEVLDLLTRDGRHHELLDAGLQKLGDFLAEDGVRAAVAQMMIKHARKEWPRVVGTADALYSVDKIADNFAEKLSASAIEELREILAQADHPLRLRYEIWLQHYIERLKADPLLREAVNGIKEKALADPALRSYVASLWTDIKRMLQADLADPQSAIGGHLQDAFAAIGDQLGDDASLRAALNEHILAAAGEMAASLRSGVTKHISQTIKAWDDQQLVRALELGVGRDLQFIRINGTVVGGFAGLLLYGLSRLPI